MVRHGEDLPSDVAAAIQQLVATTRPEARQQVVAELIRRLSGDPSNALSAVARPEPPALRPRRDVPVTYRVRVDLEHMHPPVWRRLDLASDLRLDVLHELLQALFDWSDEHLHRFSVGGDAYDRASRHFATAYDVEVGEDDGDIPEADVRLDEVLTEVGDRLHYTYDFGDDWRHVLRVEQVLPRQAGAAQVVVVTGRRSAPPEDSGELTDADERAMGRFDAVELQAAVDAVLERLP